MIFPFIFQKGFFLRKEAFLKIETRDGSTHDLPTPKKPLKNSVFWFKHMRYLIFSKSSFFPFCLHFSSVFASLPFIFFSVSVPSSFFSSFFPLLALFLLFFSLFLLLLPIERQRNKNIKKRKEEIKKGKEGEGNKHWIKHYFLKFIFFGCSGANNNNKTTTTTTTTQQQQQHKQQQQQ